MTIQRSMTALMFAVATTLVLAACSGSSDSSNSEYPVVQELRDLGYGEYLGAQAPSRVEVDGEWTHHYFDPADEGAICFSGNPFQVSYRDGPSDNLLLYLQGGGACWDRLTCYVLETASSTSNGPIRSGIIDLENPENPFGDWDIVYVPYCDGSVFIGDRIVDYGGERTFHHGLRNLSVAVDAMVENFPEPDRIVVAGSSAGGYGTYAGYGVSRVAYPSTPISRFNDSGPGVQNPDATQDVQDRLKNWDFGRLVPESCTECEDQYSYLTLWAMERDADLKTALYSFLQDGVISFFLALSGEEYEELLLGTTGDLQQRAGGRYQRFLPQGGGHTILLGPGFYTQQVDGVSVRDWTEAFLTDSDDWTDIVQD